jgi:hypothetical protein
MRTIALIFVVVLVAFLSLSAETACPGPALPEKPGSELSPETRFFAELLRLDGVLAHSQVLQGCLVNERVQFEIVTGRGSQIWEAALGEVVGYLPALGEEPRVLLLTSGEFELRPGRLVSPLMLRLVVGATGPSPSVIEIAPAGVEFFLLRGVYARLPLTVQARLLSRAILSFQQLRTTAELLVMQTGGVFSAEVLTQEFPVQLRSGEARRLSKRELGQLTVLRAEGQGVYVQIYLHNGQFLEGLLRAEALRVRVWGQEFELALREVRQIVFRDETLRFGGGGRVVQVQFCPEEPC